MEKIIFIWLIMLILIAGIFDASFHSRIYLVWASDTYGNDIEFVEIWQHNGTAYSLKHNITSSGGTYKVIDNQPLKFVVSIKFNGTLATSTTEAITYTRVYMNITGIWNNVELNNTDCDLVGSFYILKETGIWNSSGYPQAGVTYACSIVYQGYY